MTSDNEKLVLSDEEDEFINEEDRLNKLREISRIEEEVLHRQREIELLLKVKQEEQEALSKNESDQNVAAVAQRREEKQRREEAKEEARQREIEMNKRHILKPNSVRSKHHNQYNTYDRHRQQSTFAERLSSTRKDEKAHALQKQSFVQSRKYAFGLETDDPMSPSITVEPFEVDEMEKFSRQWLSKRYIEVDTIERIFSDKKVLRMDKLYAKVRPPDFREPEYMNWVLVGIVSMKEGPKYAAPYNKGGANTSAGNSGGSAQKGSKYMKLTISNFILDVPLMLFGPAFEKYWKLQVGDVVGILNPRVSPWKNPSTGKCRSFSLTLSTAWDSVVEIGQAKHFGLCKAYVKHKNGDGLPMCGTPVDKSRSEYCEYHQNLSLKRITANRLELGGLATSGGVSKMRNMMDSQQVLMNQNYKTNDAKSFGIQVYDNPQAAKHSGQDDLNMGKIYFSNLNAKRAFFDDEYVNPDAVSNVDAKRKKVANRRKEAELIKKLQGFKEGQALKAADFWRKDNYAKDVKAKEGKEKEKEKAKEKDIGEANNGSATNSSKNGDEKGQLDHQNDEKGRTRKRAKLEKWRKMQKLKEANFKVFQTAFNQETINELGFDPTRKLFSSSLSSQQQQHMVDKMQNQRGRAKDKIVMLDEIRRLRKRIHLSPSREAKLERIQRFKDMDRKVSPEKKKGGSLKENVKGTESSPTKLLGKSGVDESSDDSDLDIDFGENEGKYYSKIGADKKSG